MNEVTGELIINPVEVSDGGVYTCMASNIAGTASEEIAVEVKGTFRVYF